MIPPSCKQQSTQDMAAQTSLSRQPRAQQASALGSLLTRAGTSSTAHERRTQALRSCHASEPPPEHLATPKGSHAEQSCSRSAESRIRCSINHLRCNRTARKPHCSAFFPVVEWIGPTQSHAVSRVGPLCSLLLALATLPHCTGLSPAHAGCINVAKAVSMLIATIAPASDTQTTSTLHRALDGRGFAMRHPTLDWPTRL